MPSYNKIILLGNLTRDPQLSYTPSQTAVVDFGMATNRKWKSQDGTEREEVCFVDCRMFGKRAEVISKYLKKGNPLFVEGRLSFESWQGKDGTKHSRHRVMVETFEFVGQRDNAAPSQTSPQNSPQTNENPEYQPDFPGDDNIPF